MNAPEILKVQENHLPRIVNSICTTVVMLALIYTSYSYLLTQLEADQRPLFQEMEALRMQLKDEKDKRLNTEQENVRLKLQLDEKEKQLKKFLTQQEDVKDSFQPEGYTQTCPLDPQEMDKDLLQKALQKTLSRKAPERFEGFTLLMNNIDYLDDSQQREIVQTYLNEMDKRNRDGIYYAAFVISELKPKILKEFQAAIEEAYGFIYEGSGWERTLYKYCQIENKANGYSEPPVEVTQ